MLLPGLDSVYAPFIMTFLFVFAVVFALLSSSKMFQKNVNALIALVFAGFSMLYPPLVYGLQQFLPIASIVFIVLFIILFVKKIFGKSEKGHPADLLPIVVALAILLLVMINIGGSLVTGLLQPLGMSQSDAIFVFGLVVIVLIFAAAYYHKGWPVAKE